jgi:hypothetical protein
MVSSDVKDIEQGLDRRHEDSEKLPFDDNLKEEPPQLEVDPFGAEDTAEVKYKTLDWW